MEYINIVTIQSKSVLAKLLKGEMYQASLNNVNAEHLKIAYRHLMKCYGYKYCPIFAAIVGRKCEFYGAKEEDIVIMELKVPVTEIKLQEYYNWTDLIYYLNEHIEKKEIENLINAALFLDEQEIPQVTIQCLKPEWLIDYSFYISDFFDQHYGSGGNNVLKHLNEYK